MSRSPHLRLLAFALVAACALTAALAVVPHVAGADRESRLRTQIGSSKAQERSLASAASRLGTLESRTAREVTLLEGRVSAAQADLDAASALADRTQQRLGAARKRVGRLRVRLGQVRTKLSALLLARYTGDQPDLVTVVLDSHGFASLLETMDFLHRVQSSDTDLLALVRGARTDATHEQKTLLRLTSERRADEQVVARRRNALAAIADGLRQRRDLLAQARAGRLEALHATRSGRLHAQSVLNKLIAERERAARQVGPGGPWSIPWPIVQCESGGQNLPPNSAGASGYYQMLPSTWAGLGGSTPAAYQASKAEQDRRAATLWAGGSGAHNWVCASLVGAI